jgi:hypothetical protein
MFLIERGPFFASGELSRIKRSNSLEWITFSAFRGFRLNAVGAFPETGERFRYRLRSLSRTPA